MRALLCGLCPVLTAALLRLPAGGESLPPEQPRETPVGVILRRGTPQDVETLWRGNPGGREACNIVHNGYGGTLGRTRDLLRMCRERTDGRMRVIVRPNADDTHEYITKLLSGKHADLILGWYICDEPFAYPWDVDDAPRAGETKAEFWFRYRDEHAGDPPWPADVPEDRTGAGALTRGELASINFRGGDDLFWLFRQRDDIRAAESDLAGDRRCRVAAIRNGGHLSMFADYGAQCPTYGLRDGGIIVNSRPADRLGFWWHDEDRGAATWRENGSVRWRGKRVRRRFGAFDEDIIIDNWFASPHDAQGNPRPRTHNRIDHALAVIRGDAPETPVYFFLGYGQNPRLTRINIGLAEAEGPVAGYLLWSWGMSDSIQGSWLGTNPDEHWAAMIESLP